MIEGNGELTDLRYKLLGRWGDGKGRGGYNRRSTDAF